VFVQIGITDVGAVRAAGLNYWSTPHSNMLYHIRRDGCTILDMTLPPSGLINAWPTSPVDLCRRSMNDYIRRARNLWDYMVDVDTLFGDPWDTSIYTDALHDVTPTALQLLAQAICSTLQAGTDQGVQYAPSNLSGTNYASNLSTLSLLVTKWTEDANYTSTNAASTWITGDGLSATNLATGSSNLFSAGDSAISGNSVIGGDLAVNGSIRGLIPSGGATNEAGSRVAYLSDIPQPGGSPPLALPQRSSSLREAIVSAPTRPTPMKVTYFSKHTAYLRLTAGEARLADIAADTALPSFAGVPDNVPWSIYLIVRNSDSSRDFALTFPGGCRGAGNGTPPVYYVTNQQWAEFQINGYGRMLTNVNCFPHW